LWDTAGIEKFRTNMNITKQIKFADVVFLCFDVKEVSSFNNLKDNFYKEIVSIIPSYKTKILLGMKSDSSEINFYDVIKDFIMKENLFYAETSIYFDDNYVYKMSYFNEIIDEEKNKLKNDGNFNLEEGNFFLRAGVNVIIDLAIGIVANFQSKNTGLESYSTTNFYTKSITLSDSSIKNSCCRCMK
jgi:GTPase SAR1 family protein